MVAINRLLLGKVKAIVRNISPDGKGIGLFLDDFVEVGKDVYLTINIDGEEFYLRGQIRWRIGEKTPDGKLKKKEFAYGTDDIVEKVIDNFTSIEKYFTQDPKGRKYAVGIMLYDPLPLHICANLPEEY